MDKSENFVHLQNVCVSMNGISNISHEQIVLAYIATCIEATARTLNVPYTDVYQRMKRLGLIEKYIYPNYNVLHSESRENLALDMINCMRQWEAQ